MDTATCSPEELKRIKLLRTPREKKKADEVFVTTKFDPKKYLKKK